MSEEENRGIPVYLDTIDREVVSSLAEGEAEVNAWHPSNSSAHKLWRCLECLRDLEELLEEAVHQKNATKKKRRLKIAITPLHSLIMSIDDLLNDILCNKDTAKLLKSDEQYEQIKAISKQFSAMLPHDFKAPVSIARNKLSSHIDRKLLPNEAKEIDETINPSEFGRWLHICLHLILDLTKLEIYWWSCDPQIDGCVRLMSNEPFIVTFKVEGNAIRGIIGVHIAKESPKNDVPKVVGVLIRSSKWMFKPGQPCIRSLKEDSKKEWNTFLGNLTLNSNSPTSK
ncbi:MAG: hypothetical protein M0P64_03005 [Candidatus Pacebacteria bacterium]|nr:hypothetical protein [Candidatus Paceibacterota bacterium]